MSNNRVKHPSYGYATPQEIERLKTLQGIDKARLLKEIAKRTSSRGKK